MKFFSDSSDPPAQIAISLPLLVLLYLSSASLAVELKRSSFYELTALSSVALSWSIC